MHDISNIIGIAGVLLVLIAYYLLQNGYITSKNVKYSALNLVGAILILYSLMYHWNLASVLIELAWISISIQGLVNCYRSSRTR